LGRRKTVRSTEIRNFAEAEERWKVMFVVWTVHASSSAVNPFTSFTFILTIMKSFIPTTIAF
jgi:hypothetical protein